jgi:UDPglucose--hexose-1-phosphate uridylyltransferase
MARFVPDVATHRWVLITPDRGRRPTDTYAGDEQRPACVLCLTYQNPTQEQIDRFDIGELYTLGQFKVIPNRFPVTDIHEVIIHGPDHRDIEEFPLSAIEDLFKVYRTRFGYHQHEGQVIVFNNRGFHAGGSLLHPHSQLVVIPNQINLDALELEPIANVVTENNSFHIYCPEFSQWPYEVWIAPKRPGTYFSEVSDHEIGQLAPLFQNLIRVLLEKSDEVRKPERGNYNFYISSSKNWYLRIIPHFKHRAGLELGTGLSVNEKDPTKAAEELSELLVKKTSS